MTNKLSFKKATTRTKITSGSSNSKVNYKNGFFEVNILCTNDNRELSTDIVVEVVDNDILLNSFTSYSDKRSAEKIKGLIERDFETILNIYDSYDEIDRKSLTVREAIFKDYDKYNEIEEVGEESRSSIQNQAIRLVKREGYRANLIQREEFFLGIMFGMKDPYRFSSFDLVGDGDIIIKIANASGNLEETNSNIAQLNKTIRLAEQIQELYFKWKSFV